MIELNTITLEGPDLSGKTTLYDSLHNKSNFRWNIQDRAEFSMLCYSILYNRADQDKWRARLASTLNNFNNHTVILLPTWKELQRRYSIRGDEKQTITSLKKLYNIFDKESKLIADYSTVTVFRENEECSNLTTACISIFEEIETSSIENIAVSIESHVASSPSHECTPLKFALKSSNYSASSNIMNYPPESQYYHEILTSVLDNIDNEIAGINTYEIAQIPNSTRRFIFTQPSCISLIHTIVRDNIVSIHIVCRSSDVGKVFMHDLKFLEYMCAQICLKLNITNTPYIMYVMMNSAHIIYK